MKRTTIAAIAALAAALSSPNAGAQTQCFPDGHGGQVCNSGPEFFCMPGYDAICTPGKPETGEWCRCELPRKPFICEMRVMFNREVPQLVQIVPDSSCSQTAMQSALSVALAKLLLGQGDVFAR